jgi:hypothetical protein
MLKLSKSGLPDFGCAAGSSFEARRRRTPRQDELNILCHIIERTPFLRGGAEMVATSRQFSGWNQRDLNFFILNHLSSYDV